MLKKKYSSQPAIWVSYRTHNLSQSVLDYETWISLYKTNQNKSQNTMPNRPNIEGCIWENKSNNKKYPKNNPSQFGLTY